MIKLLLLLLLSGCAPVYTSCDTDMDCAHKFGGNGDPVPATDTTSSVR